MRSLTVLFILAIALCSVPVSTAVAKDWEKIGKEKLDKKEGQSSFRVGAGEGRYRFIKFKAEGGDVDLKEVKIEFTLGDDQKIEYLAKLRDGKETRPINVGLALKSAIRRITVKYKKKDKDKVTLIAYGRKDD